VISDAVAVVAVKNKNSMIMTAEQISTVKEITEKAAVLKPAALFLRVD